MTESVITEYTGSQRESISRVYRYSPGGVRVLDSHDVTRRLYRFDPATNTMTENDPSQPTKILRRFVFDNYGMLEETFSFGNSPRTYRFEAGGRQIVMREGGDYGAVGKTYSFEGSGVSETAFGRDGSVERVYVFDPRNKTITIRRGGWYGDVERQLFFERLDVSVFCEPEAFLQFLMFSEKSDREAEAEIDEQVQKIRASAPGQGRFAYTGPRRTSDDAGQSGGVSAGRSPMQPPLPSRGPLGRSPAGRAAARDDAGIDFIPDADSSRDVPRDPPGARVQSTAIPIEERFRGSRDDDRTLNPGRSASIPLEERFRSSREEERTLTKGRSASIPLEERFGNEENDKDELTPGRSTRISYEERRKGSRLQ
jgi:uncharacterized protein YheU (UPF0270 family)